MVWEVLWIGLVLLKGNNRVVSFYLRFRKVEKVWFLNL